MESMISNALNTIRDSNRGKEFAIIESRLSNANYTTTDSHRGEGSTIVESRISNTYNALRNDDRSKGRTSESPISNIYDCIRDNCVLTSCNKCVGRFLNNRVAILATIVLGIIFIYDHRGEGGAILKRKISNALHTLWDSDRGEGFAIIESLLSNTRDTIRDGDRGEGGATQECTIPNARDGVRNDCLLTSCNKCVGRFLDNCVAVLAAIVGGITRFYNHRREGVAITKSPLSNARNAIRNSNRGEGVAATESIFSNTLYAIRNSDRSERRAIIKSRFSNARYTIRNGNRSHA